MDEYMENFLGFEGFGPAIARRDVPAEKINKFRGHLPDKLLEYWQEYGWCGYAKGLFWTVDPDEWEDELEAWIGDTPFMQRDAYYIIGRTAFGNLILWGERTGQSLRIDTSWGMIYPNFDPKNFAEEGPNLAIQLFFYSSDKKAFDIYDKNKKLVFDRALNKLGELDHNTMYGFVPALPLGGTLKLENLQKLDAHIHLNILSQISERQIMRDICADARAAGLL